MDTLSSIEAGSDRPLTYRHNGEVWTLPHPVDMSIQRIILALDARVLSEFPVDLKVWKSDRLFALWAARHDLPDHANARRLMYLVDHYRSEIEFDLAYHLRQDLTTLFRARKWRHLLNLIDHLPRNSWYIEAVSNDEEHAEMVAKAMAERKDNEDEAYHPPIRYWSQESALLADVLDAVRNLGYVTRAANGDKAAQPPPPSPRPTSLLERAMGEARLRAKKAKHEALVARVLPHKAAKTD